MKLVLNESGQLAQVLGYRSNGAGRNMFQSVDNYRMQ